MYTTHVSSKVRSSFVLWKFCVCLVFDFMHYLFSCSLCLWQDQVLRQRETFRVIGPSSESERNVSSVGSSSELWSERNVSSVGPSSCRLWSERNVSIVGPSSDCGQREMFRAQTFETLDFTIRILKGVVFCIFCTAKVKCSFIDQRSIKKLALLLNCYSLLRRQLRRLGPKQLRGFQYFFGQTNFFLQP